MRYSISVLLFSLILVGCGAVKSKPVYILESQSDKAKWLNGKQFVSGTVDDVKLLVSYESRVNDYLAFNVLVQNDSKNEVFISHENFKFLHQSEGKFKTLTPVDPEEKILSGLKKRSRAEASNDNELILYGSLLLISLALDAQDTVDSIKKHRRTSKTSTTRTTLNDIESSEERYEKKIRSINSLITKWASTALRKTNLAPGYTVEGLVYFPASVIDDNATLSVSIDNKTVSLPYKVITHETYIAAAKSIVKPRTR